MPNLRKKTIRSQQARVVELYRLIDECEASRIRHIIKPLGITYRVFSDNADSLVTSLDRLQDQNVELWKEDRRTKLDDAHIEIVRLFHNFLASAKALVDHTRILVETLYSVGHPFRAEYDERKNRQFRDSNLSHFVHDLRNYTVHCSIPITTATFTIALPAINLSAQFVCQLIVLDNGMDGLCMELYISRTSQTNSLYSTL